MQVLVEKFTQIKIGLLIRERFQVFGKVLLDFFGVAQGEDKSLRRCGVSVLGVGFF